MSPYREPWLALRWPEGTGDARGLYHGWYEDEVYYRPGPHVPQLCMPLRRRIHATQDGLSLLSRILAGRFVRVPLGKIVVFRIDWRRIASDEKLQVARRRRDYVCGRERLPSIPMWTIRLPQADVRTITEIEGGREFVAPVLSVGERRDAALEFKLGPWTWQVFSPAAAKELDGECPGAFGFFEVDAE